MNKKGNMKPWQGVLLGGLLVLVVVLVLYIMGVFGHSASGGGSGGTVNQNPLPTGQSPNVQPALSFTATDNFNSTTLAPTIRLSSNGALVTAAGAASTTYPVSTGAFEAVLTQAGYYGLDATGSKVDGGTSPLSYKMYPNGTLSFTTYNQAGTAGGTQALSGSGDSKILKINALAPKGKAFSNPLAPVGNNPVICFKYNTTEISSMQVVGGSQPKGMPAAAVSGAYQECWYTPFHSLQDGQDNTFSVSIQATSVDPACGTSPTFAVYDQDLYVDGTGTVAWGVESNINGLKSDIGGVTPTGSFACS